MKLMEFIGQRIREFRQSFGQEGGISQEALAEHLGVSTNTISRWETATYKPTVEDLERLARFFSKSILDFFPREEAAHQSEGIKVLLRAAQALDNNDIEELQRYAEFRKARSLMKKKSSRAGSKA